MLVSKSAFILEYEPIAGKVFMTVKGRRRINRIIFDKLRLSSKIPLIIVPFAYNL
jgi:hypothetical protein